MLTLHTAPLVDAGDGTLLPAGAVAVSGDRITAVGPLAALRATYPEARVREWPGRLAPARVHTGPPPAAPSPRETVHALFARGATALRAEGPLDASFREAAARGGLRLVASPSPTPLAPRARADLFAATDDGECVATVCAGRLVYRRR
ncbi:imidazolonepropionase-like domain-containing protein [Streptomyces sp. NRRL F-5630]|uniref:imidazolonepropionase-like domain-containing protein n=1 Tax=Streptomyces sp. NRRL F-5630 TaxID=1463864 RepID=UPI003D75778B